MTKLWLIAFLAFAGRLLADGPPIDSTGKIYVSYVSITLSTEQIRHLQTNRYLKLTAEQQKRLFFLSLPAYVDIMGPFYRDCTCGQIYGMWYETDKVAFVVEDTTVVVKRNKDDEEFKAYNEPPMYKPLANTLFIGSEGQLYYRNKVISTDQIPRIVAELSRQDKEKQYLEIVQAPATTADPKQLAQLKRAIRQKVPAAFRLFWS